MFYTAPIFVCIIVIAIILSNFLIAPELKIEKEIWYNYTTIEKLRNVFDGSYLVCEVIKKNCNFKNKDIVKFRTPGKYIVGDYYISHNHASGSKPSYHVNSNKIYCIGITNGTIFEIINRYYDSNGVYYTIRKLSNKNYKLTFIRYHHVEKADINDIDFNDEDPEVLNNLKLIDKRNEIGYV